MCDEVPLFVPSRDLQLTHASCDSICGRQGPRYEQYGKLVKIDKWQAFENAFTSFVKDSATDLDGKNKWKVHM